MKLDLIGPLVVTEKSYLLKDSLGKISVFAPVSATKRQVRSLFSERFKSIKILAVNSVLTCGKSKRFKGKSGKRSDRKKFILTVDGGSQLDLSRL
ncbi:50S ribosomal protein L23 [Neorickettsia sennetsu]|uniref:Large ribosomal subunit protein uL23 n=1 Tax=Ehrlichia sennetsu (strain ATCC VR-367 / Miyayama) TaxID=222891 RepID=Q2GED7_EHRS3|nr:50S ribosomal protein L23 [Neorickettsia sennetsu]ABD46310.1 ribosomal protein L23 [Neorickettsia sennetsu str. Miyayama]